MATVAERCTPGNECRQTVENTTKISNIELWQENHIKVDHKEMQDDIKSLRNRLPIWATFLIAFLSSVATWGLTH